MKYNPHQAKKIEWVRNLSDSDLEIELLMAEESDSTIRWQREAFEWKAIALRIEWDNRSTKA